MTSSDTNDLEAIASFCPMISGVAVLKARSLHHSIYNNFKVYNDYCPDTATSILSQRTMETSLPKTNVPSITVFPNPSTGKLIFSTDEPLKGNYHLEVRSAEGSLIMKKDLNLSAGKTDFNMEVKDGMYLFYIYSDDGRINSTFKIGIFK